MRQIRITGLVFVVLILLASTSAGALKTSAQSVRSVENGYLVDIETRIDVDPSMSKLNINSYPGDVEIERTISLEAVIIERIFVHADNQREARDLAIEAASQIDDDSGSIRIRGRAGEGQVHSLRIVLPAFVEVVVSSTFGDIDLSGGEARARLTTGAGDITVEDLDSSVKITTGAGDVEATNVTGSVTARSGAGDVELNDVGADVAVITGAGDIELVDIAGRVSATTGGGQIDGRRVTGDMTLLTAGGDIELRFIEGNLRLNTSGGGIDLNEIIGDVRAATAGGDIDVRNITGGLIAETLAGDVEVVDIAGDVKVVSKVGDIFVRVVPNSRISVERIDLRAENGDIDLLLPRQMNADIRVDLGYIGSLETDRFSGELIWDNTRRSLQDNRIRRAVGRLNGGGVDIELSTGSGNISIMDNNR